MSRVGIVRKYKLDEILSKLTAKQQRFVLHFIANDGNATDAAIKAGYSKKNASQSGTNILKSELVQNAIGELSARALEQSVLTVERVLEQLAYMVMRQQKDFVDMETGETIPLNQMGDRAFANIDGWKEKVTISTDGTRTIHREVKLVSHANAVDMAMKKFGEYAPQKVEAAIAHIDWDQVSKAAAEDESLERKLVQAELANLDTGQYVDKNSVDRS